MNKYYNMYNMYMPRGRSVNTQETRYQSESETDEESPLFDFKDGSNTEDEFDESNYNIDIHKRWLSKQWSKNDREFIGYAKKMWEILPDNLQLTLLSYVTEGYGKYFGVERQKILIHNLLKSYHKGRNGKNNLYGHFIGSEHRPCCTECGKSCVGKLCGGKTHCKECKRTLLDGAFYFEENKNNNEKMRCKPAGENEGGYKRTRRRRKKNRKKRTKKKARRKRRRKSSNRRRRRKR